MLLGICIIWLNSCKNYRNSTVGRMEKWSTWKFLEISRSTTFMLRVSSDFDIYMAEIPKIAAVCVFFLPYFVRILAISSSFLRIFVRNLLECFATVISCIFTESLVLSLFSMIYCELFSYMHVYCLSIVKGHVIPFYRIEMLYIHTSCHIMTWYRWLTLFNASNCIILLWLSCMLIRIKLFIMTWIPMHCIIEVDLS